MDNNVLRFHAVTKTATVHPSVALGDDDFENFEIFKANAAWIMEAMDSSAENFIRDTDISDVVLYMDDESREEILFQMEEQSCTTFNAQYHGESGKNEKYLVSVLISIEDCSIIYDDQMDYKVYISAYRFQGDQVLRYNNDQNSEPKSRWVASNDDAEKFRILDENGKEAAFFYSLADAMSVPVTILNGSNAMKLLKQNRRLIGLYEMMHGLADFDFEVMHGKGGKDKIRAYLVPADYDRCGGAVYYEQGEFHVCHRLLPEDEIEARQARDMIIMMRPANTGGYVENLRSYSREIFKDSNAKKIQKCLTFCWDHYSPEMTFNFPLSANAYAEGRNPYSHLRVYTQYGKRELNKPEEANLAAVKKFFHLKH